MSALILVADDDPFNLRLLEELCEAAGYQVVTASDGVEVLDIVARERPQLVLLDLELPRKNGFEVLEVLKADPELESIPVVVVTGTGDVDARARGIELGAEDYITKPFRVFEIQQRIRNAIRLKSAETRAAEAEALGSSIDSLTRSGTSQQLLISLDYELTRAQRYQHPLSLIVVELTNYAAIADRSGTVAAEGCLVQLAAGLRTCIRAIDHVFRSDLSEFTLLLPETGREGADVVMQRIDEALADGSLFAVAIEPTPQIRKGVAYQPDDDVTDGAAFLRTALDRLS